MSDTEHQDKPDWENRIGKFTLEIDFGHFNSQNLVIYFSIMVAMYLFASAVPSFAPIVVYMGIDGAAILFFQIRKMKEREEGILRR